MAITRPKIADGPSARQTKETDLLNFGRTQIRDKVKEETINEQCDAAFEGK
jgi:hypothetical protein